MKPLELLISLPPGAASAFRRIHTGDGTWFAGSDPAGQPLGSGGGTSYLLHSAWCAAGKPGRFEEWLSGRRALVVHGGGQSRRLPSYAVCGKPLMPLPVFRWSRGQRLDQTLLDLQAASYASILDRDADDSRVLVTSGDVLLRFSPQLPELPEADVICFGMWVAPEVARDFGVFCLPREEQETLAFFLQKPSVQKLRELSGDYLCLVDTGMWLLGPKAVSVLLKKSGWDESRQEFIAGTAGNYELYQQFGLHLGVSPTLPDADVATLKSVVIPLPGAEFYHFGTSSQLISSISALQNLEKDERKLGSVGARRHPDQFLQNSRVEIPLRREENHTLWIENSHIPAGWSLQAKHVLTGVPTNSWRLQLETGTCLDFLPVGEIGWAVRCYGFDDLFRGSVSNAETVWLGRPFLNWLLARGIDPDKAGIQPGMDLQDAPIFPEFEFERLSGEFIEWMTRARPGIREDFARMWVESRRWSAAALQSGANFSRLSEMRQSNASLCLDPLLKNHRWSIFFRLDLESTAQLYAKGRAVGLPEIVLESGGQNSMDSVRATMFRASVLRLRGGDDWLTEEDQAFQKLARLLIHHTTRTKVRPVCGVMEDQIVWARSPVRLDLAGGWTDTPPYCLEHGGRVVNVAVDLNGQPPIQVFAKLSEKPQLVIRSIDLGVEQRLETFADIAGYANPGSEFALAKAAFAIAGFLPEFNSDGGWSTLEEQLKDFGGGIEVSLLSAVPKGSGLGTSSVLSASLLAALSDLCSLGWDRSQICLRALAMEQMVTTGGGWQDQVGGVFRGIKRIETRPGLNQQPILSWLPDHILGPEYANRSVLLYYTGVTRLAKGILREVVRGVFMNGPRHLEILDAIGENAERAFGAILKADWSALTSAVRSSWHLNQKLDAGTNPPEIAQMLAGISPWMDAAKLLGAGGGGYLMIFAKGEEGARKIRAHLLANPPNARGRFVDFSVSATGLVTTRS